MPPNSRVWGGSPTPNNVQQRLSIDQRDFLIAALIRLPALFELGKQQLQPNTFDPITEMHYSVLWRAAINLAQKSGSVLPVEVEQARALLELEALAIVEAAPSHVIGSGGVESLFSTDVTEGLIDWIYNKDPIVFQAAYCMDLFKKFLEERVVFDPFKKFSDQMGQNVVPTNIDTVINQVKAARDKIASMDVSPIQDVEITDWSENAIQQIPSNVSFIDAATDGGVALGEVVVLLGPTSGGKSLIGIQLCVEGARYQLREANEGRPSGYWYFLSYEEAVKPNIRMRTVSCAAKIELSSLKSVRSFGDLSTTGSLKEYEVKRWSEKLKNNINVPGEQERYRAAMDELGNRLQLVDMSGKINPTIGSGGINEMVQYLNQCALKGKAPIGVVIDYAGIVVSRMMGAKNERVENEFNHLNNFVNQVRVEIASRFNCIVWVLHQLHGDATNASPTTRQHHSKARGARNFADNSNFCFVLGTVDPANSCLTINCSKHRRSGVQKETPIVRLDGAVNYMISADSKWALDPRERNRIVDKESLSAIIDPSSLRRPKGNPNSGAGFI